MIFYNSRFNKFKHSISIQILFWNSINSTWFNYADIENIVIFRRSCFPYLILNLLIPRFARNLAVSGSTLYWIRTNRDGHDNVAIGGTPFQENYRLETSFEFRKILGEMEGVAHEGKCTYQDWYLSPAPILSFMPPWICIWEGHMTQSRFLFREDESMTLFYNRVFPTTDESKKSIILLSRAVPLILIVAATPPPKPKNWEKKSRKFNVTANKPPNSLAHTSLSHSSRALRRRRFFKKHSSSHYRRA